jgi:hypothetical protein
MKTEPHNKKQDSKEKARTEFLRDARDVDADVLARVAGRHMLALHSQVQRSHMHNLVHCRSESVTSKKKKKEKEKGEENSLHRMYLGLA